MVFSWLGLHALLVTPSSSRKISAQAIVENRNAVANIVTADR
jgi:hypothetical protein